MGSKVGWLTDKEEEGGKQKFAVSAVCRRRECSSDNCVSGWNFQLTRKNIFLVVSRPVHVFVCLLLFLAKAKKCHRIGKMLTQRESYFKTDSKYSNEMGSWKMKRGLLTDLTWRCKVEQWGKTRVCSPFLRFRRESLRRTHLWFYRPQVKTLFLRGRRELEKEQRQHLSQDKGRMYLPQDWND